MSGLEWKIAEQSGTMTVSFDGPLTEDADFKPLAAKLCAWRKVDAAENALIHQDQSDEPARKIRLDLGGIVRVTSWGVREWVNFIRALPHECDLELDRCPPPVVAQLNMISNFAGNARVLSVQAPYICESCGNEENVLVELATEAPPQLSSIHCGSCGGEMQFDDVEASYFAFMS